jgi:hypothetical protein
MHQLNIKFCFLWILTAGDSTPKKGGAGKGNWGTELDPEEIQDAKVQAGVQEWSLLPNYQFGQIGKNINHYIILK